MIAIASFTSHGADLGERLAETLPEASHTAVQEGTLSDWTQQHFLTDNCLVYIGAAGIAVRAIAPYLQSKATDPAVIVADETGAYVVPLLSGHIGGANNMARQIADILGAQVVITTATDLHNVFAIDVWAVSQGLVIKNPDKIKDISKALLDGETVSLYSSLPLEGTPPKGIALTDSADDCDILIGSQAPSANSLWLIPPIVAGIGCRRDTTPEAIGNAFTAAMIRSNIPAVAVQKVCTISIKAKEPALLGFCMRQGIPLKAFSSEALQAVPGEFSASAFVEETTGVDNICERSAILGSGDGARLIMPKLVRDGVTIALATSVHSLRFGETQE